MANVFPSGFVSVEAYGKDVSSNYWKKKIFFVLSGVFNMLM